MPSGIRNAITIAFVFIVVLTAVAAVAANLGLFGLDPDSRFAKATLGAVLVEIVAAVIVVWKGDALSPTSITAAIRFPEEIDPNDIELDPAQCSFEIRDMHGRVKKKGSVGIVWGHAGWECRFPSPSDLDQSITIRLGEKTTRMWEVRPFYPLTRDVTAAILRSGIGNADH